jgi:hypothetical protein
VALRMRPEPNAEKCQEEPQRFQKGQIVPLLKQLHMATNKARLHGAFFF